jgi:protein-L-isoaspartate(D-aspartate) O-methyltransferase
MARGLTSGIGMTSARTRGRMVERLRSKGIRDERVLAALGAVPRHLFVEEALASRAYEDDALPIGFGQTISHPYVVARMIELVVGPKPGRALEVGTGCGYQAAVLSHVFPEVYSIERIKALLERARRNLLPLRLANLRLAHGDGYAGLEQAAPFHSIVVAAAAPRVPEALVAQLALGGRMILPLAGNSGEQRLVLIERSGRGLKESELDPVRFVPMEAGKA